MNEGETEKFQYPEELFLTEGRQRLEVKFNEYVGRLADPKFRDSDRDTLCKIAIVRALVENGRANKQQVKKSFATNYGYPAAEVFDQAWRVIARYVLRGGEGNRGGTGLPEVED